MKTRIHALLIATVALVTLSFTFVGVRISNTAPAEKASEVTATTPVGGIVSDMVIK